MVVERSVVPLGVWVVVVVDEDVVEGTVSTTGGVAVVLDSSFL